MESLAVIRCWCLMANPADATVTTMTGLHKEVAAIGQTACARLHDPSETLIMQLCGTSTQSVLSCVSQKSHTRQQITHADCRWRLPSILACLLVMFCLSSAGVT